MLAKLTARMDDIVAKPNWTAAELDKVSNTLRAEDESLGDLVDAMRKARALVNSVKPLNDWIEGPPRAAQQELEDKIDAAGEPISTKGSADAPEAAERAKDLEAKSAGFVATQVATALNALGAAVKAAADAPQAGPDKDSLDRLAAQIQAPGRDVSVASAIRFIDQARQLGVRAGAGAEAEEQPEPSPERAIPQLVSADSALKLQADLTLFGFTGAESVSRLEEKRRNWDRLTNFMVLLIIGVVGIVTIWMPNSAWGTTFDCIIAFLAGVGTRLAIGNLPISPR